MDKGMLLQWSNSRLTSRPQASLLIVNGVIHNLKYMYRYLNGIQTCLLEAIPNNFNMLISSGVAEVTLA